MQTLFEICCGSAEDAILAYRAGASRVELNSDLFHGGLTPTLGSLIAVKKAAPALEIMAMVRPREGGFCYTDTEYAVMKEDAQLMLEHGADGIVFGFLHENGTVDAERTSEFAAMAKSYGKQSVFSRAVDITPDWRAALDTLIQSGVTRVLTSGQRPTAMEGADVIAAMVRHAAGRIEILPGSGIRANNLRLILERTGCKQLHMSAHMLAHDMSAVNSNGICFTGSEIPKEGCYKLIDPNKVEEIARILKGDANVQL